jgi:hypothetical protein
MLSAKTSLIDAPTSEAVALINTSAEPPRVMALPLLLLSEGVLERVVPDEVYVPEPISKLVPSSIT